MADIRLKMRLIDVETIDGTWCGHATAEGNTAAWDCECNCRLVGRSYFQFGHECHTSCPQCGARYRVAGDERKRAARVVKETWGGTAGLDYLADAKELNA